MEISKKPIVATLRNMAINDEVVFSILQRVSLMGTLYNRLDQEKALGMVWRLKTDRDAGTITVKRIS